MDSSWECCSLDIGSVEVAFSLFNHLVVSSLSKNVLLVGLIRDYLLAWATAAAFLDPIKGLEDPKTFLRLFYADISIINYKLIKIKY